MADSTLAAIRIKVRRLTRSLSTAQLSTADLDEYVNTFIQYDFPEHLRLFSLHRTHTFYTQPNVDTYSTNTTVVTDPLFEFQQRFITINPPFYVAGNLVYFTQDRTQFFSWYPFINSIQQVGSGDGVTLQFTGTIQGAPFLKNNVTFNSIDANGNGLVLKDVPFDNELGNLVVPDNAAPAFVDPNNSIDYTTGNFVVTFGAAPAQGQVINVEVVPYQAARPQAILYFNNTFTIRPVPDQVYPVNFEVYVRPTELLASNQSPELQEWWQYIAYGAAKKVFEDRMDLESVQQIMPEFKTQERLILRRTIVQNTNERVATIYTENIKGSYGPGWLPGGGNF